MVRRPQFGRLLVVFLLVTLSAGTLFAKKDRDWQTGKMLDTERNRYFGGMVGGGNQSGTVARDGSYNGTTNSNAVAVYRVIQTYVIEAETYAYVVEERLKWRWSKPANVTVNAPVRFAVKKRTVWILDDDGKEHETQIVKRVLRESAPR